MPDPKLDAMGKAICRAALAQDRCGELIECLFDGGSATVGPDGLLVLVPAEALWDLVPADERPTELPAASDPDYAATLARLAIEAGGLVPFADCGRCVGHDACRYGSVEPTPDCVPVYRLAAGSAPESGARS